MPENKQEKVSPPFYDLISPKQAAAWLSKNPYNRPLKESLVAEYARKMEAGESAEEALKREIREELSTEVSLDKLLCTVEYDYPKFHLTMHCYLCSLQTEALHLNEHEAARWLTKEELGSVKWLPADWEVIDIIKSFQL